MAVPPHFSKISIGLETTGRSQQALDRLTDALVDDILESSAEEILAEFEEDHGGVEQHVSRMRILVEQAVAKANERDGSTAG